MVVGLTPLPLANAASVPAAISQADQQAAVAAMVQLLALATTTGSPGLPPMQLAPGAPDPDSIPDLTFGFGGQAYDSFQSLGAALETALLNNVNLSGVWERFGIDPEAEINTALGNALTQLLAGVTINVGTIPVLGPILTKAGITNAGALLDLLGFNLANPLNLPGQDASGINIITAGPPFSLLKFLGIDLGWVPGFPNSVADEINGTDYLGISPVAVLEAIPTGNLNIIEKSTLAGLITTVKGIVGDGSVIDVRVPVVVGFGLGAFAAGMAYPQVVADLANQPGGENNVGTDPLAGSLTILPMILLRNPGRANGGLFARAYPLAALFGIDTVTPDTEVSNSSDDTGLNIPIGTTGIVLGAANLIPIKVDATVEYDPLSDFPAWPNPFSLANSAAAFAFPTYILRGVTAASLTEVVANQLTPQLAEALGNTSGPLALNLYLTVPVNNALPLLEPVKLPIDVINLFTGANLNNPVATAFEPALTTLVNLGYTDVERTVVNGVPVYDRTLDQADVITPFGTLPSNVDWAQVPPDLLLQLAAGFEKAIADGFVSSTPVANPLAVLANLIGLNGLPGAAAAPSPLADVADVSGLTDGAVAAAVEGVAPTAAGSTTPAPAQAQEPGPTTANVLAANENVVTDVPAASQSEATVKPTTKPADAIENATAKTRAAAKRAQDRADASFKEATDRLDKIAKDGQDRIQKAVKDTQDNVQKAVNAVTGANKAKDKDAKDAKDPKDKPDNDE